MFPGTYHVSDICRGSPTREPALWKFGVLNATPYRKTINRQKQCAGQVAAGYSIFSGDIESGPYVDYERSRLRLFNSHYLDFGFHYVMMTKWKVISTDEVRRNNTDRSCWLIISDMVYDVTDYMHDHPGGYEVLLSVSGGDATQKFESVGHSHNARALLKPYCIGSTKELAEEDQEIDSREEQKNSRNFERIVIYVVLLYLMAIVVKLRWIPGAIVLMCAAFANECF